MGRQSAYAARNPDRYDYLMLAEDPTPGSGGAARPTGRCLSGQMGHRFTTLVQPADSPYVASAGEIVLCDTDAGTPADITVELPDTIPNDSVVTVKKADENVNHHDVIVQPTGGTPRTIESPYFGVQRPTIVIATPQMAATWVSRTGMWTALSAIHNQYTEYYRILAPYEVLPGGGTVPIELDTALTPESKLFSIAGGVLTALTDDTFIEIDIDLALEFTIEGNNQAVEMSIDQDTTADVSRTPPIAAGIGHSRAALFLDSRNTRGLYLLSTGQTIQLTAREHYADGTSHVSIVDLFVTVKVLD